MLLKRLAIAAVGLVAAVILAAGAIIVWLGTADLHAVIERQATQVLGRRLAIGSFHISWGNPIAIEIRDLRLANATWGSRPDMVSVGSLSARIAVGPLLHGVLQYNQLRVSKAAIMLERDPQGVGNWKFGGGPSPSFGHIAVVPKDRGQFPTLIDGTFTNTEIVYRTTGGKDLRIALAQVLIGTTGDDQPVTLSAEGSYNDLPIRLKAGTDSFAVMRDAAAPFHTSYSLSNDTTAINFRGTMMQPLDYDGVDGILTIETRDLGAILKALDADLPAHFPVSLAGNLKKNGDHWKLLQAEGKLAANALTGDLTLDEAPRGGTDRISIAADFNHLDLDSLLPRGDTAPKSGDIWSTPLDLPDAKASDLTARIGAGQIEYRTARLAGFKFSGRIAPGMIDIKQLQFAFAGSSIQAQAKAERQSGKTHVNATAGFTGADTATIAGMLGARDGEISGGIDGRVEMEMTGTTLGDGLASGHGTAVFAMKQGYIARDLLEKAATDLRTLFRKGEGRSPIDCLLGVAELRGGIATVSPLTLRTPDADLVGGGTIDFRRKRLDLTVKSDPHSTGFFALDIPLRLSGPFDRLTAAPAAKSGLNAHPALPALPAAMQKLVEGSGCMNR